MFKVPGIYTLRKVKSHYLVFNGKDNEKYGALVNITIHVTKEYYKAILTDILARIQMRYTKKYYTV